MEEPENINGNVNSVPIEEKILKSAAATDVQKLANSIVTSYQKNPKVPIIIRSIGAGAVNQAVKAAIVSSQFFSRAGFTVSLVPSFKPLVEDGRKTVSIEFRVDLKRS